MCLVSLCVCTLLSMHAICARFIKMLTALRNLNQCRLEFTQPHNFAAIALRRAASASGAGAAPTSAAAPPPSSAAYGSGDGTALSPPRRLTRLRQCSSSRDVTAMMTSLQSGAGSALGVGNGTVAGSGTALADGGALVSGEPKAIAALLAGTALLTASLDETGTDNTMSCLASLRMLVEPLEAFSTAVVQGFNRVMIALSLQGGMDDVKVGQSCVGEEVPGCCACCCGYRWTGARVLWV